MHAQQDWGLERSRKILFDYNSVGLKKKLKNFLVNYAENNMAGLICHIKSKDRYVQYMLQVPID